MAQRRKKKEYITRAMVLLNIAIIVIIIALCIAVFMYLTSEDTDKVPAVTTSVMTTTGTTSTTTTEISESGIETSVTSEPATETTVGSSTTPQAESVTESTTEAASTTVAAAPPLYTTDFYANDLFIGDSITTGLYLYEYLPRKNVFAKLGLSPESALTKEIDGVNVIGKVTAMQPKRIYIMLGSNGISTSDSEYMVKKTGVLADKLKETCPSSEVYVLTVPPVTRAHELSENEQQGDIDKYNKLLTEMSAEKGYTVIDICGFLQDENGYLSDKYAEHDGMHFLGKTYAAFLSFIEDTIE